MPVTGNRSYGDILRSAAFWISVHEKFRDDERRTVKHRLEEVMADYLGWVMAGGTSEDEALRILERDQLFQVLRNKVGYVAWGAAHGA